MALPPDGDRTTDVGVRALLPTDAGACDAIIGSLPYHFGDPAGREECAHSVRRDRGLVACSGDSVVGFLTWTPSFALAYEIRWMAVHSDSRGSGIGSSLIERLATLALADSMCFVLVTTLAASVPETGVEDGYEQTRAFYRARGFLPFWEPRGWWSAANQAVLMVRPLS